jgi:hypothetical protein
MAYLLAGLIIFFGAVATLASAALIGNLLRFTRYDPPDGHERAAEREERWYPLR